MFKEMVLNDYLNQLASESPVPGGGTASAISGANAAALVAMVTGLTIGKKNYEDSWTKMEEIKEKAMNIKEELLVLADKDSDSYAAVLNCFKMPKETDEDKKKRSAAIQEATLGAALIPLNVAQTTAKIFDLAEEVVKYGNKNAVSDGAVAALHARCAVHGAILNVLINVSSLKDENKRNELTKITTELTEYADRREKEILKLVNL